MMDAVSLTCCVVGPGAVGGVLAAALAASGARVSLLGREGPHLAALRSAGLTLRVAGGRERSVALPATSDPREIGPVDVVVLAVKATALAAVAPTVGPLLHPSTVLVPALNGVPWWFLHGAGGPVAGRRLTSLDPAGDLGRHLDPARVLGCVLHLSASVPAPGLVDRASGRGIILGDATQETTDRVTPVAEAFTAGGMEVIVPPGPAGIRQQVWVKLLGNMSFNPVSALTGATLEQIANDPGAARLCTAMIVETAAVGTRLGISVDITPEERIAMARRLGPVRTSMLQDADAGRPLELDALMGSVSELGDVLDVDTPATDAVLGLLRLREAVRPG